MNAARKYIADVTAGRIVTGEAMRLAVARHKDDLNRQKSKDFPYIFDEAEAERVIRFVSILRHGKGKWRGVRFQLMPWQAFILWVAFGWKHSKTGKRRFRKVYIKVARKNAKTEFLAAVGSYGFLADREKDPEVYWFATKKDQAKIGWDRQKTLITQARKEFKKIAASCDTSTYRVFTKSGNGFVSYLGQDSHTEDGLSPYYGLCDEYHAHKTDDMMNVIESGMGSRANPMTWVITTAGFNPHGPCAQFEKVCKQILRGQIENENIFAAIFDLDDGDDWEDQRNWIKANPALPYIDTLEDFLLAEYAKAKTQGRTKEINFKTKNLNIWTTTHSTWIADDVWQAAGSSFDAEELAGRVCYGGLDLASTRDLCSLCLFFPALGDEPHRALWWHWLPEDQARDREKNDGIPYTQWAADEWITLTPGNVRDDEILITAIVDLIGRFEVQSIGYDRWGAANIATRMEEQGAKMEPFGQGFRSMSAPTKEVEKLVVSGALDHGLNPVMRWQASNVAIQMDPAENIKIAKNKSTEKVDGMVALVMAVGEWMDLSQKDEKEVDIFFI